MEHWPREQAHRQLTQAPGPERPEGRSWTGLLPYAAIVMTASSFPPTATLAPNSHAWGLSFCFSD